MPSAKGFEGFPKDTLRFLAGLRAHNDRDWFEAHRRDYEQAFLAPAIAFAEALAPRLGKIDPDISVEPRVNGSILRINRDIRFSKDKSPYKDHLDLWFWTGDRKGWDASGFFFRLTPDRLLLGGGMHVFSPEALGRYRAAVLDDRKGAALGAIVAKLRKAGYDVGTESYKKVPAGVAADHPRAALLRHGNLQASWERKPPAELGNGRIVDFVAKQYAAIAPIHRWLRAQVLAVVLAFATLVAGCSGQSCPTGGNDQLICVPAARGTLSTAQDLGLGSMVFAVSGNTCSSAGACSVRPSVTVSNRSTGMDLPALLATVTLPVNAAGTFGFGGAGAATACDPADPACVEVTGSLTVVAGSSLALTATAGSVDVAASTAARFDAILSLVLETPSRQEISIENAHVTLSCGVAGACE